MVSRRGGGQIIMMRNQRPALLLFWRIIFSLSGLCKRANTNSAWEKNKRSFLVQLSVCLRPCKLNLWPGTLKAPLLAVGGEPSAPPLKWQRVAAAANWYLSLSVLLLPPSMSPPLHTCLLSSSARPPGARSPFIADPTLPISPNQSRFHPQKTEFQPPSANREFSNMEGLL